MKLQLFSLIFVFFFLPLNAQENTQVDSLLNVLQVTKSTTQKVDTYIEIIRKIRKVDTKQASLYVEQALSIANSSNYKQGIVHVKYEEAYIANLNGNLDDALVKYEALIKLASEINDQEIIAKSLFRIALIYKNKSDYTNSLSYNLKSATVFEELKDTTSYIVVYSYIAGLSLYQDNYALALKYYLKLLEISKKKNNLEGIALCYNNIGVIHEQNNEYDDAIENYKGSLEIFNKLNDSARISDCLNNIGILNQSKDNFTEALINFKKSLDIRIQLKDTSSIAESYNSIGNLQFELENYDESLTNYFNSLQINTGFESKINQTNSYIGIGKNYFKQQKFIQAKRYLSLGIQQAKEIPSPETIANGSNYLSKVENELGNYKNAYKNHLRFATINDSLRNNEMLKKLTIMKANFAFDQRIDSLNFKNIQEQNILSNKIETEHKLNLIMIAGIVLFIVFIIILFFKNKRIKHANLKLMQANIELENQRNKLDQINDTKTRLFSIIAHDIRGPIGAFIGFFDLIREHLQENYTQIYEKDTFLDSTINVLNKSKDQILNLLDGLLNWSLKEANVIPILPENLHLKNFITQNIEMYIPQASTKNIQFVAEINEEITLFVDKNCLSTILRNLTNNALKFSPENSRITFEANTKNNLTEIKIIDEGIGMPAEKLNHIFDINEQKSTAGTKGEKGTGLGLNIVYDFVKLNKGSISVQSKENVGTVFTIVFPSNAP